MNKPVFDYFKDLHKTDIPQENGIFLLPDFNPAPVDKYQGGYVFEEKIKNRRFFCKKWMSNSNFNGIFSANMYNKIGILTPPVYLIKRTPSGKIQTASQDVKLFDTCEGIPASKILDSRLIMLNTHKHNKEWDIIHDKELRRLFLKIMTPECLDELIGLFLVDTLRSEIDRHTDNYFLVRPFGAKKFEGIMPIDLEETQVSCGLEWKDFNSFINMKYTHIIPSGIGEYRSHKERIESIMELLHGGKLSSENINLLERALRYDLPKQVKTTYDILPSKLQESEKYAYSSFAQLWDYNRETLGKELEL